MLETLRQAMHLIGRDQRWRWVLLVILAVLVSGFEVVGAVLVFVLLGLVADPGGSIELPVLGDLRRVAGDMSESTLLLTVVIGMGIFFCIRGFAQIGTIYVQRRVADNVGARLSIRIVEGYLTWPYDAHLTRNSSELIRNGHQAVQQVVSDVFVPLIRVVAEVFLTLSMLTVLVLIAPAATGLAVGVIGGAAVVLLLVVQPRLKRLGATGHRTARETLGVLQQSLHGLRDIKILGKERYFAKSYARSRLELARAGYLRATLNELPHTIIEIALVGFILIYFAITLVIGDSSAGALSVLGLFAYVGLRLQPSIQRIIAGLNNLKYSSAPIEDVHQDLLAVEGMRPAEHQGEPLPFRESLVLEEVSFTYQGADGRALDRVSLTIRPGEEIGICGPTGGGKTTLVDVLTGLLEPDSGSVTVDGLDLSKHTRDWQRNLGVVPQMVWLTDDSLRRNIALGVPDEEIDDVALMDAVELAQLSGFVAALSQGLDTAVGERGVRISGGQRQRIAIARALYRRPSVLVFDEGTSALDNETEAQLMAAIERLRGEHTIVLVAHRLSTVRNSDRVLFLEDGKVAGLGTFDQLRAGNPRFRELAAR